MFYIRYARREILRRKFRSMLSVGILTLATATIIAVYGLAAGLKSADDQALHPLGAVGSDLLITRDVSAATSVVNPDANSEPISTAGHTQVQEILDENDQIARTDLSKLGAPNQHFVHDFFLPGNQLTFPEGVVTGLAQIEGIRSATPGLILIVEHQEGTVPQIVATFHTGGQVVTVDQAITPPTAAETQATQACIANLENQAPPSPTGTAGKTVPSPLSADDIASCWPSRLRHLRATVVTPQMTITQVLSPPQTDIRTTTSTIAGVDLSAEQGFLTQKQLSAGTQLTATTDAVLNDSYAAQHKLTIGSHVTFNGITMTVVGIARPALGIPTADVYVPLTTLQQVSGLDRRVNAVFVRLDASSRLSSVATEIRREYPGMLATGDAQLAKTVNVSVTTAATLAQDAKAALSLVAITIACALTSLLATGAVRNRVREIGTLRAIGWDRLGVVRQVLLESLFQSVLGVVGGVALGVVSLRLLAFLTMHYSATSDFATQIIGLGQAQSDHFTVASVNIQAPADPSGIMFAVAAAIVAGLLSGSAAAFLAARLRPMQALRELG